MKKTAFVIPALLAGLLFLFPLPSAAGDEDLFWHESYRDALAEAKAAKKPIFLEYRCAP